MDIDIPWIVAGCGLAMIIVERLRPGRALAAVAGWLPRALAASSAQAVVVYLAGRAWDPWLAAHRPWSADGLGPAAGAALGYLAITFVYYWWHRARHQVPLLWRACHQLHHSPRRLEVITAFYKHPLEMLLNGLLSSAVLYGLVGLSPAAAALAVLATGLAELFYHWNVRTPFWLGYLVQRPESHRVHHERGRHRDNYSDLPLWDMLFGTFHNPTHDDAPCGFDARDEARIAAMLRGREVAS
jgi:sterol desaturase/sphingolipid hydroxylase (fatty acid hydroxylase superfamily)